MCSLAYLCEQNSTSTATKHRLPTRNTMANVENQDEPRTGTGRTDAVITGSSMRTRAALKRAAVNLSSLPKDCESRKPEKKNKCETSAVSDASVVDSGRVFTQCPDPVLLASIQTGGFARSAVEFNSKVYVMCATIAEKVLVYRTTDGHNYEQLPHITVKDMVYLVDIVVCSDTKQLYIAGCSKVKRVLGHVRRVPLLEDDSDQTRQATEYLPNNVNRDALVNGFYPFDEFEPKTLSVKGGRLLVVITRAILIYTPDGVEVRRIEPDTDLVKDLHSAVETDSETVIVTHLPAQLCNDSHISEISYDGSVIRQFADAKISLNYYQSKLVLCPSGRLLVAEPTGEGRVFVLNRRLELEGVLLDKSQPDFSGPSFGFNHVPEASRLITCGYYAGIVQVWTVDI